MTAKRDKMIVPTRVTRDVFFKNTPPNATTAYLNVVYSAPVLLDGISLALVGSEEHRETIRGLSDLRGGECRY